MTSSNTATSTAMHQDIPATPSKMESALVNEFVSGFDHRLDKAITFSKEEKIPALKKNEILVRVLGCSISPGDILMAQGNLIFLHPDKFPFVPGMDICGTVHNSNGSKNFQNGDVIVAANGISPVGGMAEFMAIDEAEAVLKPDHLDVCEAAACSSAITARNAVVDFVKPGDRVLILGGSGGVGSAAITLAKKHARASFVATTSTQIDFCKSLGADVVVDYGNSNWWENKWDDKKFDVIIDTVGGGNFINKAPKVLKTRSEGGSFIAVTGDDPKPDVRTWWKAIKFMAKLPQRPLYTWLFGRTLPRYVLLMPYDVPKGRKQILDMMKEGSLKIKLDDKSPHPFTEDGVREAYRIVASGHAHGKVVVKMENK
jgi:NADPH:quinone reductase-like Zn-dependent oxidoreductase